MVTVKATNTKEALRLARKKFPNRLVKGVYVVEKVYAVRLAYRKVKK